MRRVPITMITLLVAVVGLSGCASGDGLPSRMPDVVGETMADAVDELQHKGFTDITLYSGTIHATDPWDGFVGEDEIVMMTRPEARDESVPEVLLWVGSAPEVPENVPQDAWYYPHGERIAQRGTDGCLNCHEPDSCSVCHEARLEETDALFSVDPEDAPDLGAAVAGALAVPAGSVEAVYRGDGWYQVDVEADSSDARAAALAARESAVRVFPAGFDAEPEIETFVIRWMSGDEPVIEIGFERGTFEGEDWDSVEPSDIPWIADRYAVPST